MQLENTSDVVRNLTKAVINRLSSHTRSQQQQEFVFAFGVVLYALVPLYLCLCIIGIAGNLWVIAVVGQIFRTLKRNAIPNRHVLVYIVSLSVCDMLVLVTIPLVTTDMYLNRWVFGGLLCRLNYALESINKILSTFILTAVSYDRFMAICFPFKNRMHNCRSAMITVVVCAVTAFALLIPIHLNATVSSPSPNSTVLKCHNNLNQRTLAIFMSYIFLLGYLLPAVLITAFYACMMHRIFWHSHGLKGHSAVPVKKVAFSSLMVVGFYYVLWTPYWFCMMWFLVIGEPPMLGNWTIVIMYTVHALPYASSSFNWIFYAVLNKQLRQSYNRSLELRKASNAGSRGSDAMEPLKKMTFLHKEATTDSIHHNNNNNNNSNIVKTISSIKSRSSTTKETSLTKSRSSNAENCELIPVASEEDFSSTCSIAEPKNKKSAGLRWNMNFIEKAVD